MNPTCYRLLLAMAAVLSWLDIAAQQTFTRTYGGSEDESATCVVASQAGDYLVAGYTQSYGAGSADGWLMRLDAFGEEIWRQYIGTSAYEWVHDITETRDGNIVLAGYVRTDSGQTDAWLAQLNRHGELMWSRTYGGPQADEARAIIQTRDGGFAVAGFSYSFARGESDIWLLRLDAVGQQLWQKNYGGAGIEQAYDLVEARDEGFILGGYISYPEPNLADLLVVKVDRNGKGVWRRSLPAPGNGVVEAVTELPSGDILAAGWAWQSDSQRLDGAVLRLSPGGKVLWDKYYGGTGKDAIYHIAPARDGGLVLTGQTTSYDLNPDIWLLKIQDTGDLLWQQHTLGTRSDWGHGVSATRDGGYIVVGGTRSFAREGADMVVLKTDNQGRFAPGPVTAAVLTRPEPRPAAAGQATRWVLAIGVSQFEDSVFNLRFAAEDARAVAGIFQEVPGDRYARTDVQVVTDSLASLAGIRSALDRVDSLARPGDLVLIYISTHGALEPDGTLYLLPADFQSGNLFATALSMRDLTEGGTRCNRLILLDACHSGQGGLNLLSFVAQAQGLNQAVQEIAPEAQGITVITSSSGRELSFENPLWGHSAFARAALEGLRGAADYSHNQIVSLNELNLYLSERVSELTQGRQHPFMPINLFGDIPLLRVE
ncbi:MAG: caspase family protein [Bacteroidia bacterium]|nr:caspase family protein [Bacteroidia bacterium]